MEEKHLQKTSRKSEVEQHLNPVSNLMGELAGLPDCLCPERLLSPPRRMENHFYVGIFCENILQHVHFFLFLLNPLYPPL